MKQHRLSKGLLLNDKGELSEAGFHTHLIKTYNKENLAKSRLRLKEWDYYYLGNEERAVAFTVADNGYMWLVSVTFFDFEIPMQTTKTKMKFFPKSLNLPTSSKTGDIIFETKAFTFKFLHLEDRRKLIVNFPDFYKNSCFMADLDVYETTPHSMVIATPFHRPENFYYNQKINLLKAKGKVEAFNKTYEFIDALGVLDWGRGIWTYKNTWYWSSLNAKLGDHYIGFNLGYGFGDTSKATENMIFYDNTYYKVKGVIFDIPKVNHKYDYLSPWKIKDDQGCIDLVFTPILDRSSSTNVLVIKSIQHQVFGRFNGVIKINDDELVEIKDLLGFAERVENKW